MTNIPIFRAEEINSDRQVIGYLKDKDTIMEIIGICIRPVSIKPKTLAINFPEVINTNSEKVWYNLEEISNIVKEYKNGKMETN